MTDEELNELVERLNNELGWGIGPAMLCQEAASAIRQLMSERDELRKAIEAAKEEMEDAIWNIQVEMGERE